MPPRVACRRSGGVLIAAMVWGLLVFDSVIAFIVQGTLLALFVLLSAVFSAAEASLITLPVFPQRQLRALGRTSGSLRRLLDRPNRVLVTVLLGNYLFNVAAAVVAVSLVVSAMGGVTVGSLAVAVVVATLLLLTLGELVPRAVATVGTDRTARAVAPILSGLQMLLFPAVLLLEQFSSAVLRMMGAPGQRRVFLDEEAFRDMVDLGQAHGILEKQEQEMISAVIEFGDVTAGEIMVPRTDMVVAEDTTPVSEVVQTMRRTGYSRIPLYHEDIDTIIGVVYGKDLLGQVREKADRPARAVMKQAIFVPETAHLNEVLREMKTRRIHLAIVHDEYGGTAGLLSLEDVLEEIVGDIFDEYDTEPQPIEWLDPETALLDARLPIDEVNEELELDLPEEEGYETLGGFLFHKLGRPGRSGDKVHRGEMTFEVDRVANRRILTIKAHRDNGAMEDEEEALAEALEDQDAGSE